MGELKKLVIIGDSFSANKTKDSWTQKLHIPCDNLSSNGSSEYRIWKKICNTDISQYDIAVVVHTSPNRIYTTDNHIYPADHSHAHSDLIYNDVLNKRGNVYADNAIWWFENVFDIEHAEDIYRLIVADCITKIKIPCVHLTFFDLNIDHVLNLHKVWRNNQGLVNHMNANGNTIVAKKVDSLLKTLYNNSY